jgi:tetratricopeptide (TPR) repeat protein
MQCAPQSDVFLRMVESIKAGNKCLSTDQWAEAEEHFSTGLFYNSLSDACYFGRAMALFEQEKFMESLEDIDRALAFNPDHHYYDLRADILFALGRTAEARMARNTAIEIAGKE